jgi:hypothetical protein
MLNGKFVTALEQPQTPLAAYATTCHRSTHTTIAAAQCATVAATVASGI